MAYEVTATRKRPQLFDQLAGQEFVVSTLSSSIDAGRIAHAYLFSGPRGVGKTSAARILARALNCEKGPTSAPCGECTACREIARGNSLDVIEIDGASNTSVNDVREIKDEVLFAPNSSRYKVYIIDEVHMLSNSAFNALLKTIEEPPPYIVFVFATTEIHKVPATIRSRCQQFNFRLLPIEVAKRLLAEVCAESSVTAEDEALFWIAKEATGSMRDAYTLLDQVLSFSGGAITMELIREKLGLAGLDPTSELVGAMARGDAAGAIALAVAILDRGVSIEQLTSDMAEYFRTLLFIRHGVTKESVLGYSPSRFSDEVVNGFTVSQMEQAIALLLDLYRNLRFSLNQRFELDLAVSRLSSLRDYLTPTEILERINTLRGELTGSSPAGSPAPTGRPMARGGRSAPTSGPSLAASAPAPRIGGMRPGTPAQAGAPASAAKPAPERAPELRLPVERADEDEESDEWEAQEYDEPGAATEPVRPPAPASDLPFRGEVIAELRKTKLTLASALENARGWRLENDELFITFDNGFSSKLVKDELAAVAAAVHGVAGKPIKITVQTEEGRSNPPERQDDERIELVKKIFRGEVIQGEET